MPKRFNNLDAALKYLNPKGSDGESTSEAPVGSQLRFYQDWKSGKRAVEYGDRDASSRPGNLKTVAIKPFAFTAADDTEYKVDFSERAETNLTAAGVTVAKLGINNSIDSANNVVNFKPAKVIITIVGTASTPQESKLTGRKYKKQNNASYTFPFGRTTADPVYAQAKAELTSTAQASNRIISFQPEVYV